MPQSTSFQAGPGAGATTNAPIVASADGENGRLLQMTLDFPTLAATVSFRTSHPGSVWWELAPKGNVSADCPPMVMVGDKVRRYAFNTELFPRMVFAAPTADLKVAAQSGRVIGRQCNVEWRWTEAHVAHVRQFTARVDEEMRWVNVQ